jgi:hypothetical protein
MNRTFLARSLRLLLVAFFVAAVFELLVGWVGKVVGQSGVDLLPFAAAAVCVASLPVVLGGLDQLTHRLAKDSTTTAYSALAEAAARVRAGSLEQALPGLAQVLAKGTEAQRAELWLVVEDKLVSAASFPPAPAQPPRVAENLAVLLSRPDTDHVVPVLDGSRLRAVLAIGKPGHALAPADLRLMQDVANGAGMLLRGVQLNAELEQQVRRADELAGELQASRRRLTQARDMERRRLISELGDATTDRLATLRADLADAQEALAGSETAQPDEADRRDDGAEAVDASSGEANVDAAAAAQALERARAGLDELLERFRMIARGVYPAVLRDEGPYAALVELATDLPRAVTLTGAFTERLAWEVESGIYYLAASALRQLAGHAAQGSVRARLGHEAGRIFVEIEDPASSSSLASLREALTHDTERLAALGGRVELCEDRSGVLRLYAWLPEELEPSVQPLLAAASGPGG